ncbi:MAG: hypothetical protein LBK22_05695 [Tannerella sp.]|jgi:sulfur relay (sulfurtransferase) DsrC/TusE family protein|nr:hypothetical protein [Tannerella sp.]
MKKVTLQILPALFLLCTMSCNNDDRDLQPTGENGKPGKIGYSDYDRDRSIYFYYQGNRLSEIKEKGGSILRFNYENNEPVSISVSPDSREVADGHGSTVFKKKDENRITVESSGEPSFDLYVRELELDENHIPVRITETGVYSRTGAGGELTLVRDGQYYAEFTYDPATRQLVKQVVYDKGTSEINAVYEYEYDGNTGAASKIDLPLWFCAYMAYGNRDYKNAWNWLFLSYSGNIVRETAAWTDGEQRVYNYTHQYNSERTPVSMEIDPLDMTLSILY